MIIKKQTSKISNFNFKIRKITRNSENLWKCENICHKFENSPTKNSKIHKIWQKFIEFKDKLPSIIKLYQNFKICTKKIEEFLEKSH